MNNDARAIAWPLHLTLLAVAVAFPFVFSSPFLVNFGVIALFYAFIGQSWNIAGGFAGQLSFGHVVFFGAGAYASTILQLRLGMNPWLGLPVSALAGRELIMEAYAEAVRQKYRFYSYGDCMLVL